jgi:hypothetical protein
MNDYEYEHPQESGDEMPDGKPAKVMAMIGIPLVLAFAVAAAFAMFR